MQNTFFGALQVMDILLGFVDYGVMMQKPNSGKEKDLKEHYKVCVGVRGMGE